MRIPRYNREVRLPTVRIPEGIGRAQGESLQALGNRISSVGNEVSAVVEQRRKEQEHDNMTAAKNELRKFAIEQQIQREKLKGRDAFDSSKQFSSAWAAKLNEVTAKYDGRVGEAVKMWGEEKGLSLFMDHARYEDGERKVQGKADFNLEQTTIGEELERSGDLAQARAERQESFAMAVSAGHILKEDAQRLSIVQDEEDRETAFNVLYSQNPGEAMQNIKSFDLDPKLVMQIKKRHQASIKAAAVSAKRAAREEALIINDRLKGQKILALDSGDTSGMRADAEKLRLLGYEKAAESVYREADAMDRARAAIIEDDSKPLADLGKELSSVEFSGDPMTAGSELEERKQRIDRFKTNLEKFNKDPAAYVDANVVGDTPEERASAAINLQIEQGIVPESGYKVLKAQDAAQIKQVFEEADTRKKVEILNQVKGEYGRFSDDVLDEIDAPDGADFAFSFAQPYDQEIVLRAATEKIENPSGTKASDFKAAAESSELVDMMEEASRYMPADEKYAAKMNGVRKMVENLGKLSGSPYRGVDWLEDRIDVINDENIKITVPKDFVVPERVEPALMQKKKQYKKSFMKDHEDDEKAGFAVDQAMWVDDGAGYSLVHKGTGLRFAGSNVGYDDINSFTEDEAE